MKLFLFANACSNKDALGFNTRNALNSRDVFL